MFDIFKRKPLRDQFYLQHKLPSAQEHLLNIGGLLIESNQKGDSLTLHSRWPSQYLVQLLNDAWGVNNSTEVKLLLDELLQLPVYQKVPVAALPENEELYDSIKRNCAGGFKKMQLDFSREYFNSITNIAAWDIERAGLITRYAYNTGWITSEEAIVYLEKLYGLAKESYDGWLQYYLAYLKGRTMLYNDSVSNAFNYIFELNKMFKNDEYLCTTYPFKKFN